MLWLKATAFHEAGHAVAAWKLGIPFRSVSVIPGENDSLGRVAGEMWPDWFQPEWDCSPRTIKLCEKHITMSWAGPVAQQKGTEEPWEDVMAGAGTDIEAMARFAGFLSGSAENEPHHIQLGRRRAKALIHRHWIAVCVGAAALVRREQMTMAEMVELVGRMPDVGLH